MKNKIILIASILFGLMMVNSALNKFFNYMPMPEMSEDVMTIFGALIQIGWLMPLVAFAEIIGGALIAIPKTRALGAVVILPITIGIFIHHLVHDVSGIAVGFVLLMINIWVIAENRERYSHMIK